MILSGNAVSWIPSILWKHGDEVSWAVDSHTHEARRYEPNHKNFEGMSSL